MLSLRGLNRGNGSTAPPPAQTTVIASAFLMCASRDKQSQARRIDRIREMLESEPEDALLLAMLGTALIEEGNPQDAVEPFRSASRLRPDYTASWKGLGRALFESGLHEEAVAALRKGIEVARKNGDLQAVREMEVWLRRAAGPADPAP